MQGVVKLFDVFKTSDQLSFAMEFCTGGDLFNKVSTPICAPFCTPMRAVLHVVVVVVWLR